MNIRTVLRTYSLLRQLTDDETALLETLRGLTDSDREQMVETLAPAKATKKATVTTKTYERCAQCGNTKRHSLHGEGGTHQFQTAAAPVKNRSPRAASLATVISGTTKPTVLVSDGPLCAACGHPADYADHSQPSPHYHPFATSSTAQSARGQSSRSGQRQEPAASSATGTAGVGDAQAASAGGD